VEFDGDFGPILPEMLLNQGEAEAMVAKAYKTWRHILEMDAIAEGIGARGHFK
jgi:hypothetical protein